MFVVQFFKCASFTCLVQDNQTDKQRIQTFFFVYSDFEFVYYIKRLQENMLTPNFVNIF